MLLLSLALLVEKGMLWLREKSTSLFVSLSPTLVCVNALKLFTGQRVALGAERRRGNNVVKSCEETL